MTPQDRALSLVTPLRIVMDSECALPFRDLAAAVEVSHGVCNLGAGRVWL